MLTSSKTRRVEVIAYSFLHTRIFSVVVLALSTKTWHGLSRRGTHLVRKWLSMTLPSGLEDFAERPAAARPSPCVHRARRHGAKRLSSLPKKISGLLILSATVRFTATRQVRDISGVTCSGFSRYATVSTHDCQPLCSCAVLVAAS